MNRVPLMFVPNAISKRFIRPLRGVGSLVARIVPGLKYDLRQSDISLSVGEYTAKSFINAVTVFAFFFGFLTSLYIITGKAVTAALGQGGLLGFLLFLLFMGIYLRYPKILAGKQGEQVDKELIFALKDLHLQIGSGVTLYNGLVNVSKAGYGAASRELGKVAKEVSVGIPVQRALELMALNTTSMFLRKTTWQLINTLRAGASLESALQSLIGELLAERRTRIRSYIAELNLWILIYMFFSVVIPSIGVTLMIVLSSFAGFSPSPIFFVFFIASCIAVQVIIIGFVKARRPTVHM